VKNSRLRQLTNGSLTTPPCSEGVRWLVLQALITASTKQIHKFAEAMDEHNARPVQPVGGKHHRGRKNFPARQKSGLSRFFIVCDICRRFRRFVLTSLGFKREI